MTTHFPNLINAPGNTFKDSNTSSPSDSSNSNNANKSTSVTASTPPSIVKPGDKLMSNKVINGTTACFPGKSFAEALSLLPRAREKFGKIATSHVQLCPQTRSEVSVQAMIELMQTFSHVKLRLHANVRRAPMIELFDASRDIASNSSSQWKSYLKDIKEVNDTLGSPDYSIHAGRRDIPMNKMYDNLRKIQDFMKSRVAVEGLYPSEKTPWNLASFDEYADLLKQDVFFALDLSHVNIMYEQSENKDLSQWCDLLLKMLEHKNCIEVHLSDNNGIDDIHRPISNEAWWWQTFLKANLNAGCEVFTEGNQLKAGNPMPKARSKSLMNYS